MLLYVVPVSVQRMGACSFYSFKKHLSCSVLVSNTIFKRFIYYMALNTNILKMCVCVCLCSELKSYNVILMRLMRMSIACQRKQQQQKQQKQKRQRGDYRQREREREQDTEQREKTVICIHTCVAYQYSVQMLIFLVLTVEMCVFAHKIQQGSQNSTGVNNQLILHDKLTHI